MAASKEYELLFRLTAQLDNAFGSQFSTAKSVMADLQRAVNDFDNQLRDITAYQQKEAALQGLESALSEQKQKLAEVTAALQEARAQEQADGVDIKALTEAKKQHEAQIASLTSQIKAQRAELASTNAALKDEEAQIASIRQAMKAEGADTDALTADLKEHQAAAETLKVKKKEQEAAVASLTAQLKNERVGLDETTAAIKTHRDGVGALEEKQKSLQADVDGLTGKVDAQKKALQDASAALQEAGIDTGNLDKEIERIGQSSDDARQKMDAWQAAANKLHDITNIFSSIRMAADQVLEGVNHITDGIEQSVQTAAGLEYSMSAVGAISGATPAEMEQLSSLVREQGRTTIFTAQECADALQTEALAGWEVSEMMSGLPAVVSLAAAAGEDLASMSSIVSDALNAFGLDGQAAVTKFADVLVKGATSSNTTVALLGESLSYVETTAGNMGYSIEDVTLALAQMANNALKGGVAGSALNTMLTRMSGANTNAKKEMDRLGLSMYDSAGQAKPLLEFLNELRAAFQGMEGGAQEAQIAAYKLAGQRGMRGLLALVNSSDAEWNKLTDDIYAYYGAASTIADVRMDNYTGQVELLSDAWKDLQVTVGQAFLPAATLGAEVLTDLTNALNEQIEKYPNVTVGAGAFFYTLQGGLTVVTALSPALMALNAIVNTLGVSIGTIGKFIGVFGIAAAAVGAGAYLVSKTKAELAEGRAAMSEYEEAYEQAASATEQRRAAFEEAITTYEGTRDAANKLIDELDGLTESGDANEETQGKIAEKVEQLNGLLPGLRLEYDNLTGTLSKTTEEMKNFNSAMSGEEYKTRSDEIAALEADIAERQRLIDEATEEKWPTVNGLNAKLNAGEALTGEEWGLREQYYDDIQLWTAEIEEFTRQKQEQEKAIRDAAEVQREELGVQELSMESMMSLMTACDNLQTAYDALYQSTLESIQGQYQVWEAVGELPEMSMESLKSALDSQLAYWTNYSNNMATVLDYIAEKQESGYDTSGLQAYIASFDGSEDAAAAVAVLAEAARSGSGDLIGLGEAYGQVTSAQGDAAAALTAATSTLDEGVASAVAALDEAFKSANRYDEAYQVIMETLQGMEDGLTGSQSIPAVATALQEASSEWVIALKTEFNVPMMMNIGGENIRGLQSGIDGGTPGVTASMTNIGTVGNSTLQAIINYNSGYTPGANYGRGLAAGLRGQVGSVSAAAAALRSAAYVGGGSVGKGYATGTQSATPGLHVVGENGPEIVYFNGGEQVLNARETAAIMAGMTPTPIPMVPAPVVAAEPTGTGSGTVIQLSYAPVITVEGAAGADEIRQQLEEHDEALRDMLDEWITEREEAQQRVRY